MAFRGLTLERVVYPRGHKRQFMNADWGGWNGRIALIFASYTSGLYFALWSVMTVLEPITSLWSTFLFAFLLALPLAFGAYFAIRNPVSLANVVAFGILAFGVLILEANYADSAAAQNIAEWCEWSLEHCPESTQDNR